MASYKELVAQKEEIEQRIAELRKTEKVGAVARAKELVIEFDLSIQDIFAGIAKGVNRRTGAVTPKYRDPISGKTWTGRGITPTWLKGKVKEDYLINV
jgi:DNA-binding protein H-NS